MPCQPCHGTVSMLASNAESAAARATAWSSTTDFSRRRQMAIPGSVHILLHIIRRRLPLRDLGLIERFYIHVAFSGPCRAGDVAEPRRCEVEAGLTIRECGGDTRTSFKSFARSAPVDCSCVSSAKPAQGRGLNTALTIGRCLMPPSRSR